MLVGHVDANEASDRLDFYDGRLRPALDSVRAPSRVSRDTHHWTRLGVAAAFVGGSVIEGDVAIHDGEIVAVGLSHPGSGIAIPGLVDAQVNGYAGIDLLNAEVDEILEMGRALERDGVVAYQPTLITSEFDQTRRATQNVCAPREKHESTARSFCLLTSRDPSCRRSARARIRSRFFARPISNSSAASSTCRTSGS